MATLLDRVTLETWGEIVDATVASAKSGDTQARAWLAAYLLGKPQVEAPTPLAVIVQRITGNDELVTELALPAISQLRYGHCAATSWAALARISRVQKWHFNRTSPVPRKQFPSFPSDQSRKAGLVRLHPGHSTTKYHSPDFAGMRANFVVPYHGRGMLPLSAAIFTTDSKVWTLISSCVDMSVPGVRRVAGRLATEGNPLSLKHRPTVGRSVER